jgi:hypothetical protein
MNLVDRTQQVVPSAHRLNDRWYQVTTTGIVVTNYPAPAIKNLRATGPRSHSQLKKRWITSDREAGSAARMAKFGARQPGTIQAR